MKKFFIQFILLVVVIFGSLFVATGRTPSLFFFNDNKNSTQKDISSVLINGVRLNIEVADTAEERNKGLGGRQALASDSGMLFIFPKEDKYKFWMKGVTFPLDIIWIRKNIIVDIHKNALPTTGQADKDIPIYSPAEPIDKVLEVNGGFSDINNIKIGDTVSFE